jgi:hypothetical protein
VREKTSNYEHGKSNTATANAWGVPGGRPFCIAVFAFLFMIASFRTPREVHSSRQPRVSRFLLGDERVAAIEPEPRMRPAFELTAQ